ncbi:hypothetical protein OG413_28110 [Streptomyces sp. NBC_01433]|nr:hypothetical protein [Streptomyces sp. NBC_01433]MCX4679124.1 hypothetical protein [Streptomyces sp. NBC_01433]
MPTRSRSRVRMSASLVRLFSSRFAAEVKERDPGTATAGLWGHQATAGR